MTALRWYPKNGMKSSEKSLLLKLDLSILLFGCMSFFTKYLDQASITNAYVRFVGPTCLPPITEPSGVYKNCN